MTHNHQTAAAVADGHHVCCEHIHHAPATQTIDDMDFERGIWSAALYNDLTRLENFCLKGQQNARDNSNYTALHYAARAGHLQACRLLLVHGADVNARTNGGATSLHRAALMGHLEICQTLLTHQASLRLTDEDGKTALHRTHNVEIVKLFLAKDPSLKFVRDKHDRTPVDCVEDNHENCTELKALLSARPSSDG